MDFQTVWDISSICSFEVRIRIESLAMQNCESRNCQFSRKSRNIQNCFWRPSSQFTGLTWISMTLDVLLQTKVWKVWMKQQMFSKHLQTSVSTNKKIAVSPWMGWAPEIKKSWFCFLFFSEGKLDMKLKQNGRRSSKPSYFCLISVDGIASKTYIFLVLCSQTYHEHCVRSVYFLWK